MAKIVFRFDIDSHKCIRDGVPNLIEVSNECGVPFTFFVNFGRAISIYDTLRQRKKPIEEDIKILSARTKLGIKDYVYAAVRNPRMISYKENIKLIMDSQCELGIHGGRNHSHWHMNADNWDYSRIQEEINWSINQLKKIRPSYETRGFAAPGFVTSEVVEKILQESGFTYSSNVHDFDGDNIINKIGDYYSIAVNLCGEPGGIAYWEYACASGWTDEFSIKNFLEFASKHEEVVVFDHPYYAGVEKISVVNATIKELLKEGHEIVTLSQLIGI